MYHLEQEMEMPDLLDQQLDREMELSYYRNMWLRFWDEVKYLNPRKREDELYWFGKKHNLYLYPYTDFIDLEY